MLQNIKNPALKNTLWFLLPSGIISLFFFLIGFIDLLVTHSVSALSSVPSFVYYFFLIHNIPFFIASIVLFVLLEKGSSKMVSIITSNCVAIASWFVTFVLSLYIIKIGDPGIGGLLIFVIAIWAEVIFFFRSIHIVYADKTIENQENTKVTSVGNKSLIYVLAIALAITAPLSMIGVDASVGPYLIGIDIVIFICIIFLIRSKSELQTTVPTNVSSSPSRSMRIPLFGIAVVVSIVVIFILITSGIL